MKEDEDLEMEGQGEEEEAVTSIPFTGFKVAVTRVRVPSPYTEFLPNGRELTNYTVSRLYIMRFIVSHSFKVPEYTMTQEVTLFLPQRLVHAIIKIKCKLIHNITHCYLKIYCHRWTIDYSCRMTRIKGSLMMVAILT